MTKKQQIRLAIQNDLANFLKSNKIIDKFCFFILNKCSCENINEIDFHNILINEFKFNGKEAIKVNYNKSIENGILKTNKK